MNKFIKFINDFIKVIKERWQTESPAIFKFITNLCLAISGMAIAIHVAVTTAGATEPNWWNIIYPYLVGIPAGMAFVAKMTKDDNKT